MLAGSGSTEFELVNQYLAHLGDRNYSPKTIRAYGFDLPAFCRWLASEDVAMAAVTTDVLLRFLGACRQARMPGRPGPNVVTLDGRPMDQYAASTINRRLAVAFGAVRIPRHAGSGAGEPGAAGAGGPPRDRRGT